MLRNGTPKREQKQNGKSDKAGVDQRYMQDEQGISHSQR
jgi:hypothetical protein